MERIASRIACALATALFFAACAHAPPPLHSMKLVVDDDRGGVRPYVRAKVAGQPMKLLLDTGAYRSVVSTAFADANGLFAKARVTGDTLIDAHGRSIPMYLVPGVPVQFEGEPVGGAMDFVINVGREMDEGVLAPQDIVQKGFALVIDLENRDLRYEPEEAALKRLRDDPSAPLREWEFKGCLHEGFFERGHRAVTASINGVSAKMLVDTGASRTLLTRNNPALASMMERKGRVGTSEAMTSVGKSLVVPDVPITVAEASFRLPVVVHPESSRCWQGAIGADLLRHCTLVWGYSSLWAACRAPANPQ